MFCRYFQIQIITMNQNKDLKVEVRRVNGKKVQLFFKGLLGWISGLPSQLSGLGTGVEFC